MSNGLNFLWYCIGIFVLCISCGILVATYEKLTEIF
jgi:hypothetical protein